ncbi:OmpA family protein [Maribius pontilimi]|uniref:OmpA family protein n=1 Tax=Palleronia pontilimi TaxID=1964209 RepID=A0A934IF83_9RHOB|nr:OmpA family protein [Palleronia pontilimi]MBJ3761666.1 OmpA family protein [Palleronia pontilimi]
MIRALPLLVVGLLAQPALALSIALPGKAVQSMRQDDGATTIGLPVGAFDGERVPLDQVDGRVSRTAWKLRGQLSTPAQIADALAGQLREEGWTIDFTCADSACGGYDFRFASNTLPAPGMYVDLGNFRYILARGPDGAAMSLMISRARDAAWVQMTEVAPTDAAAPNVVTSTKSTAVAPGPLSDRLDQTGRVVLDDLLFASGSSQLQDGDATTLGDVAAYLADNPSRTFAIVGHTDIEGSLDANIALSRARAQAVRQVLLDRYGVPPAQVAAQGVGYLAPLGNNDTAAGRLANRRVELVVTN